MSPPTIALAGNPNSGKTTLFNALTGARQHVGNYPGVTVEKKSGIYNDAGARFRIVDLPGTYSLSAYSLEEVVARDFLVNDKPDVVVDIVDAANLERNLYLTVQFMELEAPLVIALNMIDMASRRGIIIDTAKLAELMGVPVVATVARKGQGKAELMEVADRVVGRAAPKAKLNISYGADIDQALARMEPIVAAEGVLTDRYPAHWVALKYLERDEQILKCGRTAAPEASQRLEAIVAEVARHLQATLNMNPEATIADHRYGFIKSVLKQGVLTAQPALDRLYFSDRIDKVLTHRLAGPLIMLAVIWGLYQFTFTYSEVPVGWMEAFFGWLGGLADAYLPAGPLKSMITAGIIDGVGGVMGFVPIIMFMFMGIAFLEDSGYLARVAFMLDRVFQIFGLHGSSVMAFMVSGGIAGGCAVPGVMATRTLKSRRERLATLLTVPFMNCGAKLPVFVLLVAAFFASRKALVMFLITIGSWVGALLVAKFLRLTVIRGEATPFVMELPPYRLPTFRGLLIHTWERTWQYIRKAGTVILGISIVLWALMTYPGLPEEQHQAFEAERQALAQEFTAARMSVADDIMAQAQAGINAREAEARLRHSAAGRLGTALESVSQLAGFDWRTNIALVGGFAAKEVVVSTLGTAYSLGEVDPDDTSSLAARLAATPHWGPLTALSLIVFVIFYAPCFVSVVCIAREAGHWKWGLFSMGFNTLLAFLLAVAVYQGGRLLGF
jgi:ferrous iron transport protein B